MSIPCPVSMLPTTEGKAGAFVLAALIILAITAAQKKQPAALSQR